MNILKELEKKMFLKKILHFIYLTKIIFIPINVFKEKKRNQWIWSTLNYLSLVSECFFHKEELNSLPSISNFVLSTF